MTTAVHRVQGRTAIVGSSAIVGGSSMGGGAPLPPETASLSGAIVQPCNGGNEDAVKHELMYRSDDDMLMVKHEPHIHSPNASVALENGLITVVTNVNPSLIQQTNGNIAMQQGGAAAAANGLTISNVAFNGLTGSVATVSAAKNRRVAAPDDWLSSPSPSGGAPSLTPSPGPPNVHAFTVISNGYSSPLSSGSYDPYSPNGKIGHYGEHPFWTGYIILEKYHVSLNCRRYTIN